MAPHTQLLHPPPQLPCEGLWDPCPRGKGQERAIMDYPSMELVPSGSAGQIPVCGYTVCGHRWSGSAGKEFPG